MELKGTHLAIIGIAGVFLLFLVIGALIVGFLFLQQNNQNQAQIIPVPTPTQGKENFISEKSQCPYECCYNSSSYNDKFCSQDQECNNGKCIDTDSDQDGLTDKEEREYGTNPRLADTDGDGLTDYIEIKQKGTNPLNPNTDGDRYNDAQDSQPTVVNTAKISFETKNNEYVQNNAGLIPLLLTAADCYLTGCSVSSLLTGGATLNSKLGTRKFDFIIKNDGDDYTSYINYKIKITGSQDGKKYLERIVEPKYNGRLNAGQSMTEHYEIDFTLKDVMDRALKVTSSFFDKLVYTAEVEDLDYEKFG